MIPDTLVLGIITTCVRPVNPDGITEQVWWHRCHLDLPGNGRRLVMFPWWIDRDSAIREAREFCEHLDIQIEDTI